MKIIRLTSLLDFGGQEKQYITFTDNVELLKHDYVFASIGYGGHAENTLFSRGFQVKIFNKNPSIRNLKNIWMLYKWFKIQKPDVVHTAAAEANFHGIIAATLAGVPFRIAEEIGHPNHSGFAKFVFKLVYSFAHRVICVSNSVKDVLIEFKEIEPSKGIVIYNPVSFPRLFEKKESLEDKKIWVTVGRLEKVKNIISQIELFKKLNLKETCKLIIIGDGRERAYLEQKINEYKLNEAIEIKGFVKEPEAFVSQSDFFVLSSSTEGFGIAVVEAMLQKIPCICSNVGGIPEFIEDGISGWLFDPNDKIQFEEKIKYVLSLSNEELRKIGIKGYNKVSQLFTPESYIERIEDFYERNQN